MSEHNAWNAVFWCNHDQPRVVSRFGDKGEYWKLSAKMLGTVIHCLHGTPYIYQGEETGMPPPGLFLARPIPRRGKHQPFPHPARLWTA